MKTLLISTALALMPAMAFPQAPKPVSTPIEGLRKIDQTAFKVGEELNYTIRYGIINAGEATVKVASRTVRSGREVYHTVGTGRSVGMAEWFFPTRDRYESFIDTEAMVPWEFIRDVNEDGHIIKRHLIFDQYEQTVTDLTAPAKGTFNYAPYAQDMLSSFYYARAFNADELNPGDDIDFTMFLDYEQFPFKLRLIKRAELKTKFGRVNCLVLRPALQKGRVFEDEESMTIWVTDDANKIPVLIQSELVVGSIKIELDGFKNLRHPVSFR